jgi:hypothetical protein
MNRTIEDAKNVSTDIAYSGYFCDKRKYVNSKLR